MITQTFRLLVYFEFRLNISFKKYKFKCDTPVCFINIHQSLYIYTFYLILFAKLAIFSKLLTLIKIFIYFKI